MKNHNYHYLMRAHRVACEMGAACGLKSLNRELMTETAQDIESFVRHFGGRDAPEVLGKLHETRHIHLPETKGKA